MADYRKMHYLLFNKVTDTIKELQEVQQQAEKIYILQEEKIIKLINLPKNKDE